MFASFCGSLALVSQADELIVYAISAPRPTNWISPRSLLTSTILNSVKSSYAPNGHILIELRHGQHSWMTSMTSARKLQTFSTTIRKGLGLSSLYYDFDGDLDSAEDSLNFLNRASEDGRLASIQIPVSDTVMEEMLIFLDLWIRAGSFRHYRGGQIASSGLGAGCADFVMWFMNRALNAQVPILDWMRELYLPKDLLEHTSPLKIYRRKEWAVDEQDGHFFMIPDPELIFRWIEKHSPISYELQLSQNDLANEKTHFSAKLIHEVEFQSPYPTESENTVKEIWNKILIH
ncbi:MAG: hypothetical protein KA715_03650 [Xanthomonadaceae bacterium]|nr:hypothetical protein [Xanthomonadaceae bacterium]